MGRTSPPRKRPGSRALSTLARLLPLAILLSGCETKVPAELEGLVNQRHLNELETQITEMRNYAAKLEEATVYLQQSISLWKVACRKSMSGMSLGSFLLSDGRSIASGRVGEVKDDGVVVEHDGRSEFFDYRQLPEAVRVRVVHEETLRTLELMKLK